MLPLTLVIAASFAAITAAQDTALGNPIPPCARTCFTDLANTFCTTGSQACTCGSAFLQALAPCATSACEPGVVQFLFNVILKPECASQNITISIPVLSSMTSTSMTSTSMTSTSMTNTSMTSTSMTSASSTSASVSTTAITASSATPPSTVTITTCLGGFSSSTPAASKTYATNFSSATLPSSITPTVVTFQGTAASHKYNAVEALMMAFVVGLLAHL